MNCCDANGECNQGRDCPARKTCRQRAGQPANYDQVDLWVKDPDQVERDLERQLQSDLRSIVVLATCVLGFLMLAWVVL